MPALEGMDANFSSALAKMFAAAPPEIQKSLQINSGYRSPQRQAQLWDAALKKYGSPAEARKWVAPPGNSFHNKGKAADLGYLSPDAKAWVHANSKQFGLHFPLSHEDWHIEPIGARGEDHDHGARQMPALQEVTDPEVLRAFAQSTGAIPDDATSQVVPALPQPRGLAPVTDPSLLKMFEERRKGIEDKPEPVDPATVRSDPGRVMDTGALFRQGFTSDLDEEIRNAAQSIYPNEPLEQAVKRFSVVEGELVHKGDDGNVYRARPSGMDNVLGRIAGGIGPSLPVVAGTATGISTAPLALGGPVGLAGSMLATGGAAAGGEVARQKLGDAMLGDASTNSLNAGSIVQEGAINALGQGIGAGIGHLMTRGAVRDIDRLSKPQTLRQYDEAKQQGIDITPAEATGLPSLKAQQQLLANDFRTADQLGDFYSRRNTQVMGAWDKFLGGISKAADGEEVAKGVREAAKGVIDDVLKARQKAAGPLYDAAYKQTVPMTETLEQLMTRPAIKKAATKAYEMMANAGKDPLALFTKTEDGVTFKRIPTVEEWDFIKFGLDDLIEANKNPTTGKLTSEGRIYQGLKREMLDEIDAAVPEYRQARAIYETGSEAVDNTLESAIKRMADVKDPDILRETRILFEPGMRSPEMVRRLGRSIAGKDPEAWQAVKRLYLHDEAARALRATEVGEVRNPAGKIWKTFANEKVLRNIEAALDPQELESFKSLMKVYRVVGSTSERNSWTAFMQEMQREARNQASPAWAKVVKNINPAELLRTVSAWGTERNLTKHAETVAELITSGDPGIIAKLRELRQLSPTSKRGVVLIGQLLAETSAFGAKATFAPQNYTPDQVAN